MRYQQLDKRSKAIDAEAWNRHDQAARMVHNLNVVPPLKLKRDHQGMLLSVDLPASQRRQAAPLGSVQQFRITDPDFPDTIKAEPWDGTASTGEAVHIAKPLFMSKTLFDGKTRLGVTFTYSSNARRTARDIALNLSQVEIIVEPYAIDDVIFAFAVSGLQFQAPDSSEVVWIDANIDARQFAREFLQV